MKRNEKSPGSGSNKLTGPTMPNVYWGPFSHMHDHSRNRGGDRARGVALGSTKVVIKNYKNKKKQKKKIQKISKHHKEIKKSLLFLGGD